MNDIRHYDSWLNSSFERRAIIIKSFYIFLVTAASLSLFNIEILH